LQQTLTQLLTMGAMQTAEREEEGVTVHTVTIPAGTGSPTEINYFFLEGYLVIASDRAVAEEALRAHRSGSSLAKSGKLREASPRASAIMYQNTGQMLGNMMSQLPPELRELLPRSGFNAPPTVFSVYADETSLRGVSTNNMQTDASLVLIGAAIAIPNLLRSRTTVLGGPVAQVPTANESAAIARLKTVNTAQVTYATAYPDRGFASGMAFLGPGTQADCSGAAPTADHACLLDGAPGDCTSGRWCEKNGYKFSVRGVCLMGTSARLRTG
jgi:hypothetical protein